MASKFEYIGWIPCLAGELLYGRTQPGLGEYDIVVVNFENFSAPDSTEKIRFIAVSSVYDWKDSGDPDESGVFRVVALATTRPGDTTLLQGSLYFISYISRQTMTGAENLPSLCPHEERLLSLLRKLALDAPQIEASFPRRDIVDTYKDREALQAYFSQNEPQTIASQIDSIRNKHVHKVSFTLDNFGFCRLNYIGLKDPLSNQYALPTLPENSPIRELRLERHHFTLCRQAFYFLKFLFHKHAHHDHGNDSLATIHRFQGQGHSMARALLHDLKSALVDVKRADRHYNSGFAGIAIYGKSLVTSCYKSGFFDDCEDPQREYQVQHDYFDHQSQSIRLLHERYKPTRERRRQRLATTQQLLAVVFLFVTPLILMGRNSLPAPDLSGQATDISILGFVQNLTVRLGHGDLGLLAVLYLLIFGAVFALHHLLIDKKHEVINAEIAIFRYLRTRAFSIRACRKNTLEAMVWWLHGGHVSFRRFLRGMAYRNSKSTTFVAAFTSFLFIICGAGITAFFLRGFVYGF